MRTQITHETQIRHLIDGLVQEWHNSSALAMELRLPCTNPSTYLTLMGQLWGIHCEYLEQSYDVIMKPYSMDNSEMFDVTSLQISFCVASLHLHQCYYCSSASDLCFCLISEITQNCHHYNYMVLLPGSLLQPTWRAGINKLTQHDILWPILIRKLTQV